MARMTQQLNTLQPVASRTRSASREASTEPQLANVGGGNPGRSIRNAQQNVQQAGHRQLESLPENVSEAEDDFGEDSASDVENSLAVSVSGTTPREDTFSQNELKENDPDEMEEKLGDLNSQARKLLGLFRQRTGRSEELQTLIREMQDTKSDRHQQVDACWIKLSQTQQSFTRSNFLNSDTIIRGLLRLGHTQPLPKATRPWRPDDLICKANLAILVHSLMTIPSSGDPGEAALMLDQIDQSFPRPFSRVLSMNRFESSAGHSALVSETFEFALELRTYLLIEMLFQESELTEEAAVSMLQKAMLTVEEEDHVMSLQSLDEALYTNETAKGWDLLPEPQTFENGRYADLINQRTQEIRTLLFQDIEDPNSEFDVGLDSGLVRLRDSFPWERFQGHLLRWANLRLVEIDNHIKDMGGIDGIADALEDKIKRRRLNTYASDEEESDDEVLPKILSHVEVTGNRPASSVAGSIGKIRARPLSLFRGRNSKSALSNSPVSVQKLVAWADGPDAAPRDATAASDDSIDPAEKQAQVAWKEKLSRSHSLRQQGRQQRSLMDEQPDGVRVSWTEDSGPSQSIPGRRGFQLPRALQQPSGTANTEEQLRSQPEEDDLQDPSEDEGFQQDTRSFPNARHRARPSVAPARDFTPEATSSPRRRRRTSEVESPEKRQRTNPGPSMEPYRSTGRDLADEAAQAAMQAKLMIRRRKSNQPRRRSPWTSDEIQALLEYIRDFADEGAIPYAQIKDIDSEGANRLERRTGEDLRFKARGLKVQFLISGNPMPENLELVPLGKKEKDQLEKNGIDYEQAILRSHIRDLSPV